MKNSRTVHTRSFRIFVYSVVGLAILALGVWFSYYFFVTHPREIRAQGHSWRTLSFSTDLSEERRPIEAHTGDLTGAGTMEGTTQYVHMSVLGFPEPPAPLTGSIIVTVENVEITLISIESWSVFTDFDATSGRYFLQLWKEEPFATLEYYPPFDEIPKELLDNVKYRSESPETLIIETLSNQDCCLRVPPHLEILSNSPSSVVGWNMRRGCHVTIERNYDAQSNSLNSIFASEVCPADRAFLSAADRIMDEDSSVTYRVFDLPEDRRSALVLPRSFSLRAEHMPKIDDSGENYLVFLRAADGVLNFDARPQSEALYLGIYPASTDLELASDDPLLQIMPNSRVLEVEGMVGKIAVGLDTIATDELSSMKIAYNDWPNLRWATEFLVDDEGSVRKQQILSDTGQSTSLVINGEELVTNRWQHESPEIRGAIIAGAIALLTSLLVAAWDSRRKRFSSKTDQTEQPVSAAPDNASTQHEEVLSNASASSNQDTRFIPLVFLVLAAIASAALGWLSSKYVRFQR